MELYVVFEMALDRDIMIAIFLDETDAYSFANNTKLDTRYVVAISATDDILINWYQFIGKAVSIIDNMPEMH